jgi:hypothetical protein
MGVFSGITSACCAPVLIGIMTLSALSLNYVGALAIGMSYVLGMVFPLLLAALYLDKSNFLQKPIFKKKISELNILGKNYLISVANIIGALVFFITGVVLLVLTRSGKVGMPGNQVSGDITAAATAVDSWAKQIPLINLIFILTLFTFIYLLIRNKK